MYSDKVIEHFMCPQNAYSMPDADLHLKIGVLLSEISYVTLC